MACTYGFEPPTVGVANLATRWQMELSGTLNGGSSRLLPLGFPRGEAARLDGTSEPARLADEGWRWLKVLDFPVEWRKPEHMPLIQLHSRTNLSPPLISLFCQSVPKCRLSKKSSFPPGEAKNSKTISGYHSPNRSVPFAGVSTASRPLQKCFFIVHTKRRGLAVAPFYPVYFMVSSPFS